MHIRQINIDEAHLVINLFDKYRVFYKQQSDLALAEAFINARLANNESIILVAFNNNEIPVGFTQLYPKYSSARAVKNWILNDLYVEPANRKQGIGESLIKAAMQFAKNMGAVFVQLETAQNNYTAQSLYKSVGFIEQAPDDEFILFRITL